MLRKFQRETPACKHRITKKANMDSREQFNVSSDYFESLSEKDEESEVKY